MKHENNCCLLNEFALLAFYFKRLRSDLRVWYRWSTCLWGEWDGFWQALDALYKHITKQTGSIALRPGILPVPLWMSHALSRVSFGLVTLFKHSSCEISLSFSFLHFSFNCPPLQVCDPLVSLSAVRCVLSYIVSSIKKWKALPTSHSLPCVSP